MTWGVFVADRYDLRVPAIRLAQGRHHIYIFGVDGKRLVDFATVTRARRDGDGLQGYQRPEVIAHIRAIRRYLESEGAMLPNAIVLAFTDEVRFEPSDASTADGAYNYCRPGELVIPVDEASTDEEKPAWLVDGQQRTAAIRDADVAEFPLAAVGFIAAGEVEQRAQFILVNSTKPLPPGLIHELLPDTTGELPPRYARRRLPASLMTKLNATTHGPFCDAIATPTTPGGYIKDNSVLKMIENSLYEGALYQYRDPRTGEGDEDLMLQHLTTFWGLVQNRWPDAWSLPPRKSRLTHGAGIQALGYIMDILTSESRVGSIPVQKIERALDALVPVTAWTDGVWQLSQGDERRWNGLQNTPNDVRKLTNLLVNRLQTAEGVGQTVLSVT